MIDDAGRKALADVQKIHRQSASMFLCWPTNAIDLARKDSDLPELVEKLAQFIANWERKGAESAQAALRTPLPATASREALNAAIDELIEDACHMYISGPYEKYEWAGHVAKSREVILALASQIKF